MKAKKDVKRMLEYELHEYVVEELTSDKIVWNSA